MLSRELHVELARLGFEQIADVLDNQIDGHMIVGASRNDHIGVFLRWQAEILERGLDVVRVTGQNVLEIPSVLFHVTQDTTGETCVRIGIDEQFHMEEILVKRA